MSLFTISGFSIIGVLLIILFANIRVQLIYHEEEKRVVITYLGLKKSFDLNERLTEVETAIEEQATQWVHSLDETKSPMKSKQTTKPVSDEPKPKKQSLRQTIHLYFELFRRAKQVALRLTRRFKITVLNLEVTANFEDPMLNAMVYVGLWSVVSSSLLALQQYVKVIKECHYEVKSQFSGNRFFILAECIVTVRIVDIIIVALLSISDIKKIMRTLKQKEEVS